MSQSILIVKESRSGEQRVAVVPSDVVKLVSQGASVIIEQGAGQAAGFDDGAYEAAGAVVRSKSDESVTAYKQLFDGVDIVVRAKRPSREREQLESQAFRSGMTMIGALDPFETHSSHIDEYKLAGLTYYSIDQLDVPADDPMNLLAAMSAMAGRLSLIDAIEQSKIDINKVALIGFGVVGQSAYEEALRRNLSVVVFARRPIESLADGVEFVLLDREASLADTQKVLQSRLVDCDVVITSARVSNQTAPILIPASTLATMKKGAVVVDMALSEGGNVEGSEHDATHMLGNDVLVTNVSGYPKAFPHEASEAWSKATTAFLLQRVLV